MKTLAERQYQLDQLFLGVDAGGSSCRARLTNSSGTVLGTGRAGPANARIGLDLLIAALTDACQAALTAAGLTDAGKDRITAAMGIAGISRRGIKAALEKHDFGFASCTFTSDGAIANIGAHGGGDGAIIILGTGSIGYAQVQGRSFTLGGHGFPISDEGSGAALGLGAIRRTLWARDGRLPGSAFITAMEEKLASFPNGLTDWLDHASATDYAAFAPMVVTAAEAGDDHAVALMRDAARHIDKLIDALFAQGAPRCCLAGGLADKMRPWISPEGQARLSVAQGDALDGALHLAHRPA
jgi:glucosamine kinase